MYENYYEVQVTQSAIQCVLGFSAGVKRLELEASHYIPSISEVTGRSCAAATIMPLWHAQGRIDMSVLVCFFISYYDQQMHNYFTNYHTPTCFDTIVSSSGSL